MDVFTNPQFQLKNFFISYGSFAAVLVVLFALLIYPIKASQKSWNKNLKITVESVLEENAPNEWAVGAPVEIKNSLSLNSACFSVRNRKTGEPYRAFISRMVTFYGPIAGVFVVSEENEVTFIGYSTAHGRVQKQLAGTQSDKRLKYFSERIPSILEVKNE